MLDFTVGLWIFAGGFVFFEPSPYELVFLAVFALAIVANMAFFRALSGLLVILVIFLPFAMIAVFQVRFTPVADAMVFSIVTVFLLLTSFFVANYVAQATEQRMRLVIGAYTAAAVVCALIGTLAYLGLIPGAELFLLYGRAKATFNDPNVFAPFLVLPAMYALQKVLLGSRRQQLFGALVYLVLFVGVFLSFSRAAWGHLAASSLIVLVLCFCLEATARDKVRIMIVMLIGTVLLAAALAGLFSVPAVAKLFEVRAQAQSYDTGELGRFGRQGYAFGLVLNNPWGIGPLEFRNLRVREEPHNVYINVLLGYGWGGGILYFILVLLTLKRGFSALLRSSPYRLVMIPLIATFSILVVQSAIIDTDHWRHWFLLVGLIWGVSAAMAMDQRRMTPGPRILV